MIIQNKLERLSNKKVYASGAPFIAQVKHSRLFSSSGNNFITWPPGPSAIK